MGCPVRPAVGSWAASRCPVRWSRRNAGRVRVIVQDNHAAFLLEALQPLLKEGVDALLQQNFLDPAGNLHERRRRQFSARKLRDQILPIVVLDFGLRDANASAEPRLNEGEDEYALTPVVVDLLFRQTARLQKGTPCGVRLAMLFGTLRNVPSQVIDLLFHLFGGRPRDL